MSSPLKSAPTLNSTTSALSNLTLNPPPSTADFSKISNAADEAEFATGLKTIKESDEAKGDEGSPEFIQENDEQERFMNSLFEEKNRSADKSPAPGDGSRAEYAHALSAAKNEKLSIRDFEIISELGSGNYGKVLLVKKKKDGSVFAMKVLQKQRVIEKKQVAHTMTERNVLAIVSKKNPHPYLISLHYAFQSSKRLYFIMDYCAGGELFFHLDKWDKFSEQMAKFYCAQVALALGHLHSLNIIYRDLKPENVLLDIDGNIRLADFGLSKISLGNEGANTLCGTAEYLAPETLMGHRYYAAIDWWALGVLVYELTTGLPPFRDPQRNCKLIYEKILKVDYDLPPFLSEECKDIIKRLLIADPEKRLGTKGDLSEIKSHPFFKDIDWDKLLKKQLIPPYKPIVNSIDDTSNFHSTPSAGFLISSTVLANRASAAAAASNPAIMNPTGAGHQRRHTKAEEFKHFSFNENDYPNVK